MNGILKDRGGLYGDFNQLAKISQELKAVMKPTMDKADPAVKEALEMICHKMARIANGEEGWKVIDNFDDIAGYSKLASDHLLNESGAIKTTVISERLP